MKFDNFDKIKKIATKTAIGAGFVAAPIISTGQNNLNNEVIKKNLNYIEINTNQNNPEFYINEYIKYMEHPSYKKRLAKEMYGDEIIDESKQKNIDDEFNKRLSKIYNIIIELIPDVNNPNQDSSYYSPNHKYIKTTPNAAFHEIQHRLDNNDENFMTRQKGFEETKRKNINLKKILEKNDYYGRSDEIKARLTSLRLKAITKFGFDLGFDFDINKFEQLKNDTEYKTLKNILQLSDEQINELMKYTAMNNNMREKNTYAHPDWDYGNEDNKA